MKMPRAPPKEREAEGDATIAVFTVPLGLYMIFSREMCIVNRYYWETKERNKRNDKNFRAVRGDR